MSTTYRLSFQFGLATLLCGVVALLVMFVCERHVEPSETYPRPHFPLVYLPAHLVSGLTAILLLMTVIVLVSAMIETLLSRIGRKAKSNHSDPHSE